MTPTTLSLRYAALSDVGRVRKDNQDSGYASERLLVIADGVGGAARGDISSSTAVQILSRLDEPAPDDILEALAGAIHRTHDRIAELVDEDPELEGTSTTVTAALFDGTRIGVGHVGDSRGYLLRDGALSQLTRDHTFVQSLIDEGRITEEESRNHPHRNLILRAVDGARETDPDLFFVDLAAGDRLLLCSDGCSGVLEADRLADILGTGSVDYAVVELIRASLDAGSNDNITCVVADVVEAGSAAAAAGGDSDGEVVSLRDGGADTGQQPMLVGAAAEQPRKAGANAKSTFWGHRGGDTGELDPVPSETAGEMDGETDDDSTSGDPEAARYAPRAPRRFAWLRRVAILLVVGAVLTLIVFFGYRWTQNQYYVSSSGDRVAIYQGVQVDIPGLTLTSVEERSEVTLAALSQTRADRVRDGIVADDLDDAREIVTRIGSLAKVCPAPTEQPTDEPTEQPSDQPSGQPSGQPSPSRSPGSSPRQGASPGRQQTQEAEPSPTESTREPSAEPSPPPLQPPDCVEESP